MNCSILKKEFFELKTSIDKHEILKPNWLENFLQPSYLNEGNLISSEDKNIKRQSIGHIKDTERIHTRIGVQKGSTLMQALSDTRLSHIGTDVFYAIKNQRRENITNIIKNNGGSANIKDILTKINTGEDKSPVCSEKTLQRELMSMIKDGVLNKVGEKRWSRYVLVSTNP
jgi:hypothetical protein